MEEEAAEEEAACRRTGRARKEGSPPSVAAAPGQRRKPQEPGAVVLSATGISVSFGGLGAVDEVDLTVPEGQLVGLIGPNGAGKTTFIDAISGFVPYRGRVELDGRRLDGLAAHRRAQPGLARTWQSIELFDDLTVRENLAVASYRPSAWSTVLETLSRPVTTTKAAERSPGAARPRADGGRDA